MRPLRWVLVLLVIALPVVAWWAGLFRGPSSATVEGVVRDDVGPLHGAHVRFRGSAQLIKTDAQGHFRLSSAPGGTGQVALAAADHLIQIFPADHLPATVTLPGLPADQEEYHWIEPGPQPAGRLNCVNCHRQIYEEWNGSAHARAAVNRHFLNYYDGSDWHGQTNVGWNLRADRGSGASVCAACHAPTVEVADPAFDDLRKVQGVNARGVHCDYCHKIAEAPLDDRGLTFGRFGYPLRRPKGRPFFFGPLDDAERPGEDFAFAPLYRDSRYCASCHEGVVFGVPVYTTYSEWLASPAAREGKQCQSCHMTPTGTLTNIAPGKGGIERDPRTLASHRFPGGQLDRLRGCLKVDVRLEKTAAGLRAGVEVRAREVGHRVPTGFIDRNLVLLVEGLGRDGKPVPAQSGPVLPGLAGEGFAGKPGRLYARQYATADGRQPLPFWQPGGKLRDTRLYPGRPDRSEYLFPGEVGRVRVRLFYRRSWKEVADRKRWPDNEIVVLDRTWPGK